MWTFAGDPGTPPDPEDTPLIELTELQKEFAGVTALDGITLSVAEGEIHGIVGRSGAGKSTLIRCLTGLERSTSGSARIDGIDITALSRSEERRVGKERRERQSME